MREVKRYGNNFLNDQLRPYNQGDYVLYSDYKKLEKVVEDMNKNCISLSLHDSRMNNLEKENDELKNKVEGLQSLLLSVINIIKENMK